MLSGSCRVRCQLLQCAHEVGRARESSRSQVVTHDWPTTAGHLCRGISRARERARSECGGQGTRRRLTAGRSQRRLGQHRSNRSVCRCHGRCRQGVGVAAVDMGVLLYVCVCVCCCCCFGLRLTLVLLRPAGCAVPTVYEQCIQNVHGKNSVYKTCTGSRVCPPTN